MKRTFFSPFKFYRITTSVLMALIMLLNGEGIGQNLPSTPKNLIDKSFQNWNEVYGITVKAINWSYEGQITNEAKRNQVLNEITDPQKAWFPSGDVGRPVEMTALRISDDPSITNTDISNWKAGIQGMIKIGQHIARLNWTKGGVAFTSVCITDETSIVYDNMLSNALLMDHNSICLDIRLGWIWQRKYADMTRGEIKAELFIKCPPPPICDHKCDAYMTLGQAKINCKAEAIGNCCKLSWSYGWACGFKKVKVKAGKFEIEIEGNLGSSGKGNGSCTECCPVQTTSLPKPSLPVQTAGGSVGTDGPQKIRTISFSTLSGEVVDVKVPNIIRPGDQISFSVTPKKSSSTLDGAVVDVQDKKSDFKNKLFTIIVPAGLASFPLLIKDNNGTTLARTDIPVNVPRIPSPGNNIILPPQQTELPKPNSPGSFAPLNYCQPGQPLTINGFFDGNATNTNVSINNIPVEIIAESENGSFVQVPDGLNAGKGTIKIEEGGVSESMPIQVVTVNMSSNKTLIEKNGTAKVDIVLDGLGNVDLNNNNFKLELINSSPEAIAFRDANTNTLSFDLNNANVSNGIAKLSTNIKGIATGPYSIRAELTSTTCTECWTQYEICVAQVEAEEKQCYKDCDKNNGGISCYLACSAVARIKEAECFAQYLGCVRKKLGN